MNYLTKNIRIISVTVFVAVVILVLIFINSGKKTERSFFCFDTFINISLSGKNADAASDEIEKVLFDMEKTYNKFRKSAVSEFNSLEEGNSTVISEEMAELVRRCQSFSRFTEGAFDITTSALSDLWQFKTASTPPTENDIKIALEKTGYEKISLNGNILTKTNADIDFGGVLKGLAADKVRSIAQKHGITSGIVNLGGNVCLIGSKDKSPWTIGVTNPFSPGEIYLTIEAENTNVITSGAYQRYFESGGKVYHHILSPQTGYPAETDVASVTIISSDGTLADALSTAIFVLGSEKGLKTLKQFGVEFIIIKKDGSVIATDHVKYKMRDN